MLSVVAVRPFPYACFQLAKIGTNVTVISEEGTAPESPYLPSPTRAEVHHNSGIVAHSVLVCTFLLHLWGALKWLSALAINSRSLLYDLSCQYFPRTLPRPGSSLESPGSREKQSWAVPSCTTPTSVCPMVTAVTITQFGGTGSPPAALTKHEGWNVPVLGWPWLAARCPPSCSFTSLPQQEMGENKMKSSWAEIRTGRSLTSYQAQQNRLNLVKIKLIYFQLVVTK